MPLKHMRYILSVVAYISWLWPCYSNTPMELGDALYHDSTYTKFGIPWGHFTPGHCGIYLGLLQNGRDLSVIHCEFPGYTPTHPLPDSSAPSLTKSVFIEKLATFTQNLQGYHGARTHAIGPSPAQRLEICSYALSKYDLPISYWEWFTKPTGEYQSPTDNELKSAGYGTEEEYKSDNIWIYDRNNLFNCVTLVEAAFEHAKLDLTPSSIQSRRFLVSDQWSSPNAVAGGFRLWSDMCSVLCVRNTPEYYANT